MLKNTVSHNVKECEKKFHPKVMGSILVETHPADKPRRNGHVWHLTSLAEVIRIYSQKTIKLIRLNINHIVF